MRYLPVIAGLASFIIKSLFFLDCPQTLRFPIFHNFFFHFIFNPCRNNNQYLVTHCYISSLNSE